MKNRLFEIEIDPKTGCMAALYDPGDAYRMNWCAGEGAWGRIDCRRFADYPARALFEDVPMALKAFEQDEAHCRAEYAGGTLCALVERFFAENGNLRERVTVTNASDVPVVLDADNFGIEFPFPDSYTYAAECLRMHCHTHIWCGGEGAWINAVRMGPFGKSLGLALVRGAFDRYTQSGCRSNVRGLFALSPAGVTLLSGASYVWEWELFWHESTEEFEKNLLRFPNQAVIHAEHFTVFEGERIRFDIQCAAVPRVTLDGEDVPVQEQGGAYHVDYEPARRGVHRFEIALGAGATYAEFNVKIPFETLLERRVRFIAERQQCRDENSPLCGAFLIYDNATGRTYFDNLNSDHNACRERLNMAFVLAKYLQQRSDPALRAALDRFVDFVFREIYDEKTGEVFNTIRKNRNALRLYNAPGVMFLFCETYFVTHEKRLLECAVRLADAYYSIGGEKCYSNAVEIRRILSAFDDAGMPAERAKMRAYFKRHVDTMVKNGLDYPKHEVNYEQTIVTPAVKCIAEMGEDSEGEERAHYLAEAKKHLACLERFCGMQPSFHLYGISVRYWDDFWFGKQRLFGDTLPHHLSCLTARAYYAYARLSGEEIWRSRADEIIRNCLCLIDDDGRGHAAYVYPYRLNEARGELYDEWANDQDLPLYDGCAAFSPLRAL